MKTKTGDVILQKSDSVYGRAITFLTRSDYNHAMVCLPKGKVLDYGLEGCKLIDMKDIKGDVKVLRPKKIGFMNKLRIIKNSFGWKKVPYDKRMIGKFFLLLPFEGKRHELKTSPKKSICTKTVKTILEKSGVKVVTGSGDYYTPDEFCKSEYLSKV